VKTPALAASKKQSLFNLGKRLDIDHSTFQDYLKAILIIKKKEKKKSV